jgi:transcriptional regulator GlxA family with amidase domain
MSAGMDLALSLVENDDGRELAKRHGESASRQEIEQ